MKQFTVFFRHPTDDSLELVHINTLETRYVHLMFFGKLATEWGFGWDNMQFAQATDLGLAQGSILIHDRPLNYNIFNGYYNSVDELATLSCASFGS